MNTICPAAFRFGVGAQFPTRSPLKFTTEWYGEIFNDDVVTRLVSPAPASIIGDDGSVPPVTSNLPLQSTLMFGATWQTAEGVLRRRRHQLVGEG